MGQRLCIFGLYGTAIQMLLLLLLLLLLQQTFTFYRNTVWNSLVSALSCNSLSLDMYGRLKGYLTNTTEHCCSVAVILEVSTDVKTYLLT